MTSNLTASRCSDYWWVVALMTAQVFHTTYAVAQTPPMNPRVLSGIWTTSPARTAASGAVGGMAANPGMGAGGGRQGNVPVIKPEYLAQFPQGTLAPNQGELPNADAARLCVPDAFFGTGGGYPTLIIQTRQQVTIVNEENHRTRRIYLDRQHPKRLIPSYAGHSIGHWDGNTLVVNTVGLLNREGGVTPPGYYVEERFTRKNDGQQLEWLINFHSDAYVTPGSKTVTYNWRPDLHIQEQVCEEFSDNFNENYTFK
ncbi:MAG: hypothetical protein QM808_05105 [Steroidobacteraceae bacterium]